MAMKDTPNLPASSRMQMPNGNGGNISMAKKVGTMSGKSNGTANRVLGAASGTGLKSKNPYC